MASQHLSNIAYRCFLVSAACLLAGFVADLLGRGDLLPQPVAAGLLVFVVFPLIFGVIGAALGGIGLAVWLRNDPRLFALSGLSVGLIIFWIRRNDLALAPEWALFYPLGVALFALRWILRQQRADKAEG